MYFYSSAFAIVANLHFLLIYKFRMKKALKRNQYSLARIPTPLVLAAYPSQREYFSWE